MRITGLRLRGVLDSRAQTTVEADLALDGAPAARGSCPRAIAPGRRERHLGTGTRPGPLREDPRSVAVTGALVGRDVAGQAELDAVLDDLDAEHGLGVEVVLSVSLAFARAAAAAGGRSLSAGLADLAGLEPAVPRLLVNLFSGGIHRPGPPDSYQQVMLVPRTGELGSDIDVALAVYEQAARRAGRAPMSASSGLLVEAGSAGQLALAREAIEAAGCAESATLAIDVAAEHLSAGPGRYRLGGRELSSGELAGHLAGEARRFGIEFVEDPFDPADAGGWRRLRALSPATTLVGDDLFATDAGRIDPELADSVLLKPSQAGTITRTLETARAARAAGMRLVVSHRSGETEDTAICDLAVAVGAELIKVGGPRRGDRIAKYNQLLRCAEDLADRGSAAATRSPRVTTSRRPPAAVKGERMSLPSPTMASRFRTMMNEPEILVVPSAYDALAAKVIEQTGFKAVHMTGSGTSASMLGLPDLGFTTTTEMAWNAKNITMAVDLPVIMDIDAGYGNAMNTWRCVREFERAGIVGGHLEDQVVPKRCGHLEGKRLISDKEMIGKIEAAVEARQDPDWVLIARTDAREKLGLDEAIRRSREYVAAGADCIFLEAMLSVDEMKQVRDAIDAPLLANMVEGGKTPWLTTKELEAIGYNLAIYPLSGWLAATSILRKMFTALKEEGTTQDFWDRNGLRMSFEELFEVFDYSRISELEARFVVRDDED